MRHGHLSSQSGSARAPSGGGRPRTELGPSFGKGAAATRQLAASMAVQFGRVCTGICEQVCCCCHLCPGTAAAAALPICHGATAGPQPCSRVLQVQLVQPPWFSKKGGLGA